MKKFLPLLIFIFTFSSNLWAQEALIRARVDEMFQGMYAGDTARLRTCFIPGATFYTYSFDSKGNPRAKGETLADFLRGVSITGESQMEERLVGWQCLIDDGIASVWTPYEFYFEGKFSHCGVNNFQLIRVHGDWKISQITDTRRRTDCHSRETTTVMLDSLINAWHHAAAVADENAFFGFMAEDGIYIGTDATERWLRDELRVWSQKYFAGESAWDFKPLSRTIRYEPGSRVAWFDELLDTWMGTCRSTGILEIRAGQWKLIHYHLSIAVPNDKLDAYRTLIGKE
jgi:hypothetical protein